MLGAEKAFSDKTSIKTRDLVNGKEFLKCMSYEDASKVNSTEIFNVFETIKGQALSWSAVSDFTILSFVNEKKKNLLIPFIS